MGLNAYHGDSSACLVVDGKLIAAAEEERFCRIKHWAGFPSAAVRYCLKEAGIGLDELDHVAINQDSGANLLRKVSYTLAKRPDLGLILDRIRNKGERANLQQELEQLFPGKSFRATAHHVEHHLCHLASAFLVSPFERAAVVSVDGFGDFASASWGIGDGHTIEVEDKVYFPHSLGIFYEAMTQYLGFPHYGDEYKVMGLAPYGTARFLDPMRQIVRLRKDGGFELDLRFFRHAREKVAYEWDGGAPKIGTLYTAELEELLGPARKEGDALIQFHKDVARSVQAMYEEAFFHLLNAVHDRYPVEALGLAGGCAMNSVANGKVYERTPFKRMYVQSAAGDAGGAIGAAAHVWSQLRKSRLGVMDHAYWGPGFSEEAIAATLESRKNEIAAARCRLDRIDDEGRLCIETAQAIADGSVVGWFQGRMEWGPRALGNRSILADPRRPDMKEILNTKIKRRESFRPFAPSILREAVPDWFETDDDVPFMMQVHQIKMEKRPLIPAVTHVDGSGRLQTVSRQENSRYYRLIEEFAKLTGIPILLNTSFNENEPVVCNPGEALDCFLRTRMDLLVLGNRTVRRAA